MASSSEIEEEVRTEVGAVQAVYGDDCLVIADYPPHLVVHVRPRTADDSSQQFVELFLGIKASAQYPNEPPYMYAEESKGLDDNRQADLITCIQKKAEELTSCPMLVILCEEAVEILSNMNHPAGDCPLCLYPLVTEDKNGSPVPFMKLMSCYHCFHSECIMRCWKWCEEQNNFNETEGATSVTAGQDKGMHGTVSQHKGICPVCRKLFDKKDIKHVLNLLGGKSFHPALTALDFDEDVKGLLSSEMENNRRKQYGALAKLQEEKNGLIEPRKDLAIQPGMYISLPPPNTSAEGSSEQCEDTLTSSISEIKPQASQNNASTDKQNKLGTQRKHRDHGSRRHKHSHFGKQQWLRKGADP